MQLAHVSMHESLLSLIKAVNWVAHHVRNSLTQLVHDGLHASYAATHCYIADLHFRLTRSFVYSATLA